jgi:nitrite reductase (NADH) small subunit
VSVLDRPLTYVWVPVYPIDRLTPDRGVAALADGHAVAVFLLSDGTIHVLDNIDPCSGASVLSRGLVGDVAGVATVASPLYKQRFELAKGRCLDADVSVRVHDAHVIDGVVHVRIAR